MSPGLKKFPHIHTIMLLVTLMLLGVVAVLDFVFTQPFYWIDLLWLIPVISAAIFLSPVEIVIVGLLGAIISVTAMTVETKDINLWSSSLVALSGIVAAGLSIWVRHYLNRVTVIRVALENSPLAYAEFRFPGYALANFNSAFRQMSAATVSAGPGKSLFDSFPEDTAALMSRYMDEAISTRAETSCDEFYIPAVTGLNTYWSVNFIPVAPTDRSARKSVALLAFEVSEAVTRSRTREAAIRISAAAMSSLNLDETIRVVMDGLAYIAGTDGGSLLLLEDDQWVGKAGYGTFSDEMVLKLRYPYEELQAPVDAVERKEVVTVFDVSKDSRFSPDLIRRFHSKSCMVVPLVTGNRIVGAAHLVHTDETRDFTEEQIKFATIIGSHAALAIDNALIYHNEHVMRKSLEAIEVVSEAGLVSLDLEEVLIELVNRTQDVMQMDAAMILLYDKDLDCLVGRAATSHTAVSSPVSDTRLKVGQGLAGRAFQEGAPLKIDNIQGHEEEMGPADMFHDSSYPFSEISGIVSVLAVPLRVAGKVMGVLQIGSRREAVFSAREWGLIQVLADRASLAVQNSMLHEETKRELARTTLLRDVAAACAGSQNLKLIAETALQAIYHQLGCQIASIYWLDKPANCLVNLAFIGHPENIQREYRVSRLDRGSLLTRAVVERRIITHEEVNLDNATEAEAHILKLMDIGYHRKALVPVLYQGEPVGAMALVFPDKRPFTPAAMETIKSIAHQLAVAFNNLELDEADRMPAVMDQEETV
ncbi:MAG: GAF domain-containing protein [Thermoleophilia bacterium]